MYQFWPLYKHDGHTGQLYTLIAKLRSSKTKSYSTDHHQMTILNTSVKSRGRFFYEGKKTRKKKKKSIYLKQFLSIRKRASKLTNLNSIYQLSLLLVSNKNKSLRAVLKPKLLLCQYFPYSASWPTVIIEFESVFFMMFPGTEHERLCQSVLS